MFDKVLIKSDQFCLSTPEIVTDQSAQEPDVVLDAQNTLWVVWSERQRAGDIIRLRSYQEDQEAGPIIDCSTTPGVEFQPVAVCQPDGIIRLVWVAFRDQSWHLISRALQDGILSDEQIITSHPDGLFHPRLVIGPDRNCWLAFEKVEQQRPRLMVSHTQNDRWGPPAPVATPDAACYRPSLVSGLDQGVWMAYDAYLDGAYQVYLQRIDQPSEPVAVTENGYQNLQATLAPDRDGNLWIAWASNQNEAYRAPWWMTKWTYLRRFDGQTFGDPVSAPPGKDVYNEDSFQGWEFPQVMVDSGGRIWIFGQSSHTLYAQYYAGTAWSPLYTIAPRHWGSWKPRMRATGSQTLYLVSMGLGGAQIQKLEVAPSGATPVVVSPVVSLSAHQHSREHRERATIHTPDGETLQIFFGDLHAHSAYSDATNDVDEFYHRYRDAYGYDFATLTDHDYLDGIELSLSELKMLWNHSDRMTAPGKFVAMYGYEWTAPAIAEHAVPGQSVGEGHRHILYPDQTGPLVSYGEESANTGKKLLKRLKGVKALVIPHHTSWSGTDWEAHDEELQRLIEVCSTHGRFEYPGNKPIGYRRDHIHVGKFVLDGLARGHRLGFVGGSDSHGLRWHATEVEGRDSHVPPGTRVGWKEDAYRTGMTAVLAPELTREALYEALYHRRCYATSGVPIVLDFRIDGQLMGSDIVIHAAPRIDCFVTATAPIRSAEIVRSGHVFAGLQCREGEGLTTLSFSLQDTIIIPGESHYYYLRLTQEDGNMAWSSPIWVQFEDQSHGK
jgi:hypothetical protein